MVRGGGLLAAPVGDGQANRRADVRSVQRLLNAGFRQGQIGLSGLLVADGLYGRNTRRAIAACLRDLGGAGDPSCVIAPDGEVWRALCAVLPQDFGADLLGLVMAAASQRRVDQFAEPVRQAMVRYHINSPLRQAHFLAQIGHESGELRYLEELADGRAYEGRRDLGNTQTGDGPRFKGRGLIQLTGRDNYTRYSAAIGRRAEILDNPALVATDPDLCVDVAGYFWDRERLNSLADRDDLLAVTRRINGGLNGLEHRRALLSRARSLYSI